MSSKALMVKVGMSLFMLGYAVMPKVAGASTITGAGSSAPEIEKVNNVYNIYAGTVNGPVAVNTFNQFALSKDNIANLYFNKKGVSGANGPTKLFNFVNSKIDINGTVNAIRDSKIGGDLYFLAPQGMIVGAAGVINTGSLTVITPTEKWWKDNVFNGNAFTVKADNVKTSDISQLLVPINPSGTITVMGNINTNDGVHMKAATINVGVQEVEENGQKSKSYNKANVKTNVVDFTSLVNLTDAQKRSAGLSSETDINAGLKLSSTTDGKIVLAAESISTGSWGIVDAESSIAAVNIAGGSQIIADGAAGSNGKKHNIVEITALAAHNAGVIEYTKDGNKYYKVAGIDNPLSENEYEKNYKTAGHTVYVTDVTTNATINITNDGATGNNKTTIQGERVDIEALASVTYESSKYNPTEAKNLIKYGLSFTLNGIDAGIGVLDNRAIVNIGSNTVITADGTDVPQHTESGTGKTIPGKSAVNIQAIADEKMDLGALSFGLNAIENASSTAVLAIPGVAIVVGKGDNKAEVTLGGNITANTGSVNTEALASNKFHASAVTSLPLDTLPADGFINLAFSHMYGTNNSKVDVLSGANITANNANTANIQNININAASHNDVEIETDAAMGDKGAVAAGMSFTDYRSDATVNIDGFVNAKNGLTVNAEGIYSNNEIIVDNEAGVGYIWSILKSGVNASHSVANLQRIINDAFGSHFGAEEIEQSTIFQDVASFLKVGLSVNKAYESNISTVKLGENANLTAGTAVNINADSILSGNHLNVVGASKNYNYKQDGSAPKGLVNGGVMLTTFDNKADVIIEGKANDTSDKISANNVKISSTAEAKYDRIVKNVAKLKGYSTTVEGIVRTGTINADTNFLVTEYSKVLKELNDYQDAYMAKDVGDQDFREFTNKLEEFSNNKYVIAYNSLITNGSASYKDDQGNNRQASIEATKVNNIEKVSGFKGFLDKTMALIHFVMPETYVNYHAGVSTSGQSVTDAAVAAIAPTFDWTKLNNDSKTLIGNNVNIKANNKLEINSVGIAQDVAFDGKLGFYSGGNAVTGGIVVGLHDVNANNIITIGENSRIIGTNEFDVTGNLNTFHCGLSVGLGMGTDRTYMGNIQIAHVNSNNLIAIDDEVDITTNTLKLNGRNTTHIVGVTGGLAMGSKNGIGIALGINDISRNNIVAITDTDGVYNLSDTHVINEDNNNDNQEADDEETRLRKLLAANIKEDTKVKDEKEKIFGIKTEDEKLGTISAYNISSEAKTGGKMVFVSADVGVVQTSDDPVPGFTQGLKDFVVGIGEKIKGKLKEWDDKLADAIWHNENPWGGIDVDKKAENPDKSMPSFTLTGAGSISIVELDGATAAIIDSAHYQKENKDNKLNIGFKNSTNDDTTINLNTLSVQASDDSLMCNISGGGAGNKTRYAKQIQGFYSNSFIASAGVAVNNANTSVYSAIKNTNIINADKVENKATREGSIAAAAAAVDIVFAEGATPPTNFGLAGGASADFGRYSTKAVLQNTDVNTSADITKNAIVQNLAETKDLEVTGALELNVEDSGKNNIGVGTAVTRGYLRNDVEAIIEGGSYKKLAGMSNKAITDLTQYGIAVGGGVSKDADIAHGNYAIQGAIAYNAIDNYVNSKVKNATIETPTLDVLAYDTKLSSMDNSASNPQNNETVDKRIEFLNKYNIGTDASYYINTAMQNANINDIGQHGGVIVTGALQLLGANATQDTFAITIGGSVVVNNINNNYNALMDGVTLNNNAATKIGNDSVVTRVLSESSNLVVDVAAGVSIERGDKTFQGSGSVTHNHISGGVSSKVINSNLYLDKLDIEAKNLNKFINVAADIQWGSKSLGVHNATNDMNTITSARLMDTDVHKVTHDDKDVHAKDGVDIEVDAENTAKYYAIAAGAGKGNIGLTGAVALNFGNNDIEAIVGSASATNKHALNDVKGLTVHTVDDTNMSAGAGGLFVAGALGGKTITSASIGGAFGSNNLGKVHKEGTTGTEDNVQTNKAEINNYIIKTLANSSDTINVNAMDTANIITVGSGVAVAHGEGAIGAVEGAGAYTRLNKKTEAAIVGTDIDKETTDSGKSRISVDATSDNKVTNVAAVVSVGLDSYVAAGGAVGITETKTNTAAHADQSNIRTDNLLINAKGENAVTSVAAGGTGGTDYVTAAGSVNINDLGDSVSSYIDGGNYVSHGNIGVTASGNETLNAGAGTLSIDVSLEKLFGISAALSMLKNNLNDNCVVAYVKNADISAEGSKADSFGTEINGIAYHDSTRINKVSSVNPFDEESENSSDSEANGIKKPFDAVTQTAHGIVVDAYGRQDITNVAVTAGGGLDLDSPLSLTLSGALALSEMGANTHAYIHNTDINKNKEAYGDVVVTAYNNTEMDDVAVNANIAINIGSGNFSANGSFGFAAAKENLNRNVLAEIKGKDDKNALNAASLKVKAASTNDINDTIVGSTVNVTLNLSEGVGLALGANANDDLMYSTNTVKANVENISGKNGGTDIEANHFDRLESDTVGVLLEANIPTSKEAIFTKISGDAIVGYTGMYETNTISANLINAEIIHPKANDENSSAIDIVKANNYTDHDIAATDVSIDVGILSAGVAVSEVNEKMTDTITTNITGSTITGGSKFDAVANNNLHNDTHTVQVKLGSLLSVSVSEHELNIAANSRVNVADSTIKADVINISNNEYRDVSLKKEQASVLSAVNVGYARNYVTVNDKITLNNEPSGEDSENDDSNSSNDNDTNRRNRENAEYGEGGLLDKLAAAAVDQLTRKEVKTEEGSTIAVTPLLTRETAQDITLKGQTGSSVTPNGMETSLNNANLEGVSANISNKIEDKFDLYTGSGNGSIFGLVINSSELKEKDLNRLDIIGGSINADTVKITSNITGEAKSKSVLGFVSAAQGNDSRAKITVNGSNAISIKKADVATTGTNISAKNLEILASNDGDYTSYIEGGGISGASGSKLTILAEDNLDNTVDIEYADIRVKEKAPVALDDDVTPEDGFVNILAGYEYDSSANTQNPSISIKTSQTSNVKGKASFGAVNLVAGGVGYVMDAKMNSNNNINLLRNYIGENSLGEFLNINSLMTGTTFVEAKVGSGSAGGGGSGITAEASTKGSATINAQNNTFDMTTINAHSLVGGMSDNEAKTLAKADISAVDISVAVGADNDKASTTLETTSNTNFSYNTIKGITQNGSIIGYEEVKQLTERLDENGNPVINPETGKPYMDEVMVVAEDENGNIIYEGGKPKMINSYIQVPVYEEIIEGKTDLKIKADTVARASTDIDGANVGLGIAVGHKEGNTTVKENTYATFNAKSDEVTYLKALEVDSSGLNKVRNHVDGSGGGILGISPRAGTSKTDLTTNNNANVSGKINVAENVEISAKQSDNILSILNILNVGAIAVGGGEGKNTLIDNTKVNVTNAEIQAKKSQIVASNEIIMNPSNKEDDETFVIDATCGGAWSTPAPLTFTNNITDNAVVDIRGSKIYADGDLDVLANTVNDVNAKIKLSSASPTVTSSTVNMVNNHNYQNKVKIDSDSTLKTTAANADINIIAADNSNMQIGAYANANFGIICSVAVPKTINHIVRTNIVDIGGNVVSNNNLNMYAGDYFGTKIGGLDAVIDCEAYSGAFISISDRKFESTVDQINHVTISGSTSSVGNTDINATEGSVRIKHNYIKGNMWKTDSAHQFSEYVSIDRKKIPAESEDWEEALAKITVDDKVTIEGSVTAGSNNKFNLQIGKSTELVILNEGDREKITLADNPNASSIVARPTLKLNDVELDETAAKEKIGDIKYYSAGVGVALLDRYAEINDAITAYSDVDSDHKAVDVTYQNLLLERASIITNLEQMGLAHNVDGVWVVEKDIVANVIELPDISSGGGNITIHTDDITGSGNMRAHGAPELTITNDSNMYLKLNNVTVGDLGGKIKLNDRDVDCYDESPVNATQKAKTSISTILNKSTAGQGLQEIIGEASTNESKIEIKGVNTIREIKATDSGKTETIKTFAPIELAKNKTINNKSGSVLVRSYHDSLFLNGTVNGTTVRLLADEGNLTQISEKGILNIGGTPELQYKDEFNKAIENFNVAGSDFNNINSNNRYKTATYTSDGHESSTAPKGGAITGGNIFLGGVGVNINGLVQSGYDEYNVSITDSTKIDALDASWNGTPLKDSEIMNEKYMISEGKAIYDNNKGYCTYQIAAYYNPSTKKIVVPDVETYGGNISISGAILSTGNGKIMAVDGTYNINVNNTTTRDLQLGNLIATNMNGRITINDTAKGTRTEYTKNGYSVTEQISVPGSNNQTIDKLITTEYTKDGYTVYDHITETSTAYTANGYIVTDYKNLTADGQPTVTNYEANSGYDFEYEYDSLAASQYNPKANIRYNWNYGTNKSKKVFYEHKIERTGWGLFPSKDTDVYAKGTAIKSEPDKTYNKDKVSYTNVAGNLSSYVFYVFGSNNFLNEEKSSIKQTSWKTGFLGWRKHKLYEWNVTTGSSQQYMASVKADNAINIGFLGKETSTINVNSFASVDMTGNIGSEHKNLATVNITSSSGHLTQNSSAILADNVNLQAAGHMQGINIISGDELNLTAKNTAGTNQDYYYNGSATKVSDGNKIDINIKNDVTTKDGVTDFGHTNLNGLIGNATNELVQSINLKTTGSLYQGNGGLVSGLRIDFEAANGQIGTKDNKIRVNTGDNVKLVNPLSASLNAKAKGDINLKETAGDLRIGTIYSDTGDVSLKGAGSLIDALPYENNDDTGRSEEELIAHWTSTGLLGDRNTILYDSEGKALTTTDDTGLPVYKTKTIKDYQGREITVYETEELTDKDGNKYTARVQERNENNQPIYYQVTNVKGWDKDLLLYSISDAIINPKAGVELPAKAANIKAHSIDIEVGSNAGLNAGVVFDKEIAALTKKDIEFISQQDASNVIWNNPAKEDGKAGHVVIRQKLPIGVLQSEGGTLVINAGNEETNKVYVEGRSLDPKDTTITGMDMNIKNITTSGDVLLKNALGGIYTASGTQTGTIPTAVINGASLEILVGLNDSDNGNIGTIANGSTTSIPLYVNINGPLHATATGDMNIYQVGNNDLVLEGISGAGNITLTADKGIRSLNSAPKEDTSRAYIRLENKESTLTLLAKDGDIGNDGNGRIVVLNRNDSDDKDQRNIVLEAHHTNSEGKDDGSVYIYGNQNPSNSKEPAGTLYINSIAVGEKGTIDLDSFGYINVKGNENVDVLKADSVKLNAALDVNIVAKNLEINNVNISAGKHQMATSTDENVYGGDVSITAERIVIGDNGSKIQADALIIDGGESEKGNVTITATKGSLVNSATVTADQNIALSAKTTVQNTGELTAGNDVNINAEANDVSNSGAIVATNGNASINAGATVNNVSTIVAGASASITAGSTVENTGTMTAGVDASISAKSNITNEGSMTATNGKVDIISENGGIVNKATAELLAGKGNVTLQSQNKLENYGNVQASSGIVINSTAVNVVNTGNLTAKTEDVSISAGTSVKNSGKLTATAGNASISAGTSIDNSGMLTATAGNVSINAGTTVNNVSEIVAGTSASVNAGGTVNNVSTIVAGVDASIRAQSNVTNEGAMTATNGKVDIISENGSIVNKTTAELFAGMGNITLQSQDKLENYGKVQAFSNVLITSNSADVINKGNLTAETENVSVTAGTSVENSGKLTATAGNASINAGTTVNNVNEIVAGASASITAGSTVENTGTMTAGVDASIRAQSNVTNEGAMTATDGKVDIVSAEGSIVNKTTAELFAGNGGVTLQSQEKLENNGKVQASKNVVITSNAADVVNTGELKANNDITVDAGAAINNSGNIESVVSGNVTLKSKEMLSNSGKVNVKLGNVDLLAGVGSESVEQTTAIINNSGALTINGNVTLKAYGSDSTGIYGTVTNSGEINSPGSVILQAASVGGSVVNLAIIDGYAAEETDELVIPQSVTITAMKNIYNGLGEDDFNTTVKAQQVTMHAENGSVDNYMNVVATIGDAEITSGTSIINKGHIIAQTANTDISAGTFVDNYGNINALQASNITAGTNITNSGSMSSITSSTISAGGDIVNNGMMMTSSGPVSITSTNGSICNNESAHIVAENGKVTIKSEAEAKTSEVINRGDILAVDGDILLESVHGSVYNYDDFAKYGDDSSYNGTAIATGNISLLAKEGTLYNVKNLTASNDVYIMAMDGLDNFSYNITAGKNINLTATSGNVINVSVLESEVGNVTINSQNGSVFNLSGGDIIATGGNVELVAQGIAEGESYTALDGKVYNNGSVVNYGDILASNALSSDKENSGSITLQSAFGNVYNYDDFNRIDDGTTYKSVNAAANNITLSAVNGTLYNDLRDIVALGNVNLEAKECLESLGNNIYAGKDITITTDTGNLVNRAELISVYGDISMNASHGTVVNMLEGDILALAGNVTLYAGGEHEETDAKNTLYAVTPNGVVSQVVGDFGGGVVVVDKYYTKDADGNEVVISDAVNINSLSDTEKASITTKLFTFNENGERVDTGIVLSGDQEVFRQSDVVNRGDIVALGKNNDKLGSISLHSENNNVTNYDNFAKVDGKETYYLDGSKYFNEGTELNKKTETITLGKRHDEKGELIADNDVHLEAPNGYFYNDFNINTKGDLGLISKNDLIFGDNFSYVEVGGDLTVESTQGKVIGNGQEILAGGNVTLTGKTGVDVDEKISAGNDVSITAVDGNVEVKGAVEAVNAVNVNASNDVLISGDVITKLDNVTIEAGSIATLNGNVTSGAEVTVKAQSIVTDGTINAQEHILMDASNGNLSINKSVENTAGGIELYATDGVIDIADAVTAGADGLLRVYAELKDQAISQEIVDAVIANGELKSINGSVDIGVVNGDIDLRKVTAKEMAAIGTDKGNIVLGDISAGTVVLYNKDSNSSVAVDKVVVGQNLVIQSADPEIKKIQAAPGVQQITLDITGTGGKIGGKIVVDNRDEKVDYQISNLAVGTARIYTGGNISVNNLYANGQETSELIAKEGIAIDSLAVANKLFASGYNYTASVYGTIPKYDSSNAIYYDNGIGAMNPVKFKLDLEKLFFGKDDKQSVIDSVIKELGHHTTQNTDGSGKCMNLYIYGTHNQSSNGLLVHNDNYYYVHNQRYSAEALSSIVANYKAANTYGTYYSDNLGMFDRYNLYELSGTEVVNGQIVAKSLDVFVLADDKDKENKHK